MNHLTMNNNRDRGLGPTIEGWVRAHFKNIGDLSRVYLQVEMKGTIHKGACTSEISISHKKKPYDTLSAANYFAVHETSDFVESESSSEFRDRQQELLRDMVAKGIPGKILPVTQDWDLQEILLVASETLVDMYRNSPLADKEIKRHNELAEPFLEIHKVLEGIGVRNRREGWSEDKLHYVALGQLEGLKDLLAQKYGDSDAARASQASRNQFAEEISHLVEGIEMFQDYLPRAVTEAFREIVLPLETEGEYFINNQTGVVLKSFMEWAEKYCSVEDKEEAENLRMNLDCVYSGSLCETYNEGTPQDAFDQIDDLVESAMRILKIGGERSTRLFVNGLYKMARKAERSQGFVPHYVVDHFVKIIEPEDNFFTTHPDGDWTIRHNTGELLEAYREWGRAYCELGNSDEFEKVRELKVKVDSLLNQSMPLSVQGMYQETPASATTSLRGQAN